MLFMYASASPRHNIREGGDLRRAVWKKGKNEKFLQYFRAISEEKQSCGLRKCLGLANEAPLSHSPCHMGS